ncbi:hypothetical protein ABPG74_022314 [Tetrahymena malaccensis]
MLSEQDILDIKEVRQLHFNFDQAKCQDRCKIILQERPHLFQIRTYYGFFLVYDDLNESYKQQLQVYEEAPYYFENTSYMLDNIICNFQKKGRDFVKSILKQQYSAYQGEKDGFYYICLALIYRIEQDYEKSYEILISKVNDYNDQPMVQTWFYHQLGCHFQNKTNHGDDEDNENVKNTLKFFEKGLEIQPRSTMNIQNIGVAYQRIGTEEAKLKSIEYYKRALNINREDHFALCNLSVVLYDLNQFKQSFQIIQYCFQKLKFNAILYQYLYLIINQYYALNIQDIDQVFTEVCQGLQRQIQIEANNESNFENFYYIFILSIQHARQLKYVDLFESIIQTFRKHDMVSLVELEKYILGNLIYEEEGEDQSKLQPVIKLVLILIQKELIVSQQLLSQVAYKNIIQSHLKFQQSFSHWDLFIDL